MATGRRGATVTAAMAPLARAATAAATAMAAATATAAAPSTARARAASGAVAAVTRCATQRQAKPYLGFTAGGLALCF